LQKSLIDSAECAAVLAHGRNSSYAQMLSKSTCVTTEDIERARNAGSTDLEIHDTVLIAAAFCMYNRYVDGLATWAPDDESIYRQMADRVVKLGYTQPGWEKPFSVHKPEKDFSQTK
jgi:hypothetical protein